MTQKVTVVGGTNTDLKGESYAPIVRCDSNIGKVTIDHGGVGHNIALNLARMGKSVSFITALGNDVFGESLRWNLPKEMDISSSLLLPGRSDIYLYVCAPEGDMYVAVNDMENIRKVDPEYIKARSKTIEDASIVIVEANLNPETVAEVCAHARGPVYADAVSTLKVDRLVPSFEHLDVFKPNLMELEYLYKKKIDSNEEMLKAAHFLLDRGVGAVLLTLGKRGSVYISPKKVLYSPSSKRPCVNSTGAGDALLAGFAFGMMEWGSIPKAMKAASAAAEIAIQCEEAVSPDMNGESIYKIMKEKETYAEIPGLF